MFQLKIGSLDFIGRYVSPPSVVLEHNHDQERRSLLLCALVQNPVDSPPTLLWKTNPLRPTLYKHNVVILSICNVVDAGRRCCGQPAKQHQNSTKVVPENVALVAAPKETKRVTRMSETPRESCVQCEYRYRTLGRAIRCVGGVESFKTHVSQTKTTYLFLLSFSTLH